MATIEATASQDSTNLLGPRAAWIRWWLAGTRLDWGFVVLGGALIGAGYYQSWVTRSTFPNVPSWASIPPQVAWLAVTLFLAGAGLRAWRREGDLRSAIPEGYEASVAGCAIFLVGIVINGWWTDTLGAAFGVPAIFRLPNLLEVTGGVLIVLGPLRASTARGELVASPTALLSATLLLAAITFFTQFDHPYIDRYATVEILRPPNPLTVFDAYDHREQILGALGLMMQAAAVTGVILWTLRQTRLPVGSITLMLTATAFLTATQLGHFSMVGVAAIVGVIADAALAVVRPRADRVLRMHVFALLTGALLAGVYLVWIGIDPGTWWAPDMTYGSVLACAIVGGIVSYVLFPGAAATRAASVLWPPTTQDSSPESPDITVERVEHALRVMHSTRDLADSPLIAMRCLSAPTPGALRQAIESAIAHLEASAFQQDAQAGQILDLYYVRRIGGHYAVEMRVGLSRAAYFNRRSYGVRRLVDSLRELEESAASA